MSASDEKVWQTTAVQNLVRYAPSGTYFARFRVGGKLVWKSLKTATFSVAKQRLPHTQRDHRSKIESFADAEVMGLKRLKKQHAESLYQMRYQIRQIKDNATMLEGEIANIREDLRTRTSTRGDNFVMAVKNETFTDRIKAGRALIFLAAALKPFESTKTVGNIGGFPISIERFDERATILITGKHSYRANVSDSPAGTIASLEHALDGIEDRLRERETSLTQSRRQTADLTNQLDQPFEHEETLAVATKRQQEIVTALDITKKQASAAVDQGTEQVAPVMEQTPSQNQHCEKRAVVLAR